MKEKQVKSVIWLFLKINQSVTMLIESSRRCLCNDMVVKGFSFKNSNYALFPFYLKTQNRYRTTQNRNYFLLYDIQ